MRWNFIGVVYAQYICVKVLLSMDYHNENMTVILNHNNTTKHLYPYKVIPLHGYGHAMGDCISISKDIFVIKNGYGQVHYIWTSDENMHNMRS